MGGARTGAGRKVISIETKKTKGTLQNCRENKKIKPSTDLPVSPKQLNKRAREIFDHMVNNRLVGMGIASASHTETLALLCKEMEQLERVDKYLEENGFTYEDDDGKPKLRPEVGIQKELNRHVHTLLCGEFGLSPGSSGRISTMKKPDKPDNPFGNI